MVNASFWPSFGKTLVRSPSRRANPLFFSSRNEYRNKLLHRSNTSSSWNNYKLKRHKVSSSSKRLHQPWYPSHRIACSTISQLCTLPLKRSGIFSSLKQIYEPSCLVGHVNRWFHTSSKVLSDASTQGEFTPTPKEKDPSLEYTRSGKKFLDGPNQIIPSKAIFTTYAEGAVQISKLGHEPGKSRPPISVPGMLKAAAEESPNSPALLDKRNGKWVTWTYEDYYEEVRNAAKGFIALGLQRHEAVCILGFNSPEWFIANHAAIMAGGIPVGIYTTNSPTSCSYIAQDSKASIFLVDDEQQLCKVIQKRHQMPHLSTIIQYKGKPCAEGVLSWEDLTALGSQHSDQELTQRVKELAVNKCCTLIYTSGTTGRPKGVMLSHDNLTWLAEESAIFGEIEKNSGEVVVSYLPLSHVAAQTADIYTPIAVRAAVYFADKDALRGTLVNTLKEVQPTKFLAVPRVWEKMYETMMEIGRKNKGLKLKIANWAKEQGTQYSQRLLDGHPNPETWRYKVANNLIFSKVRKGLGIYRSDLNVSAAAPIRMEILEYFASLGIIIAEAYGLSESSGPHSMGVTSKGIVRFGSIGHPLTGLGSKLVRTTADGEGELCIGGRHVMMGYLHREDKTREALDDDGWFHTGDLSRVDEDGYIFITGRIKELIITAGGENVAPVPIEDNIKKALPCLSNAMVIGDKLKFLSVLISFKTEVDPKTMEPLDKLTDGCKRWIDKHGNCVVNTVKDILNEVYKKRNSKLINAINSGIMLANAQSVSRAQRVQKWVILKRDFSVQGGELGPTLKLKRQTVCQKHKDVIEDIYKDDLDPNSTGALG